MLHQDCWANQSQVESNEAQNRSSKQFLMWNYEELEEVKRRLQLKDCFRCLIFSYQFAVAFLMLAEVEKLYVDKDSEFRKRYLGLLLYT